MKTLSVIIPVYNTSKVYFFKCLESLQCKRAEEIEVIVVDDGSSAESSSETKKQVDISPLDIRYYKKENGGQNSAREYGLKNAVGKYIFFMDSDDYVDTDALDRIIALLKDNSPDILAFNYDVRTPKGEILEKHNRWQGKYSKIDTHKGLLYSDSLCLQIYKKDVLYKSGISLVQGVKIGEDMATATALLAVIGMEYATEEYLYHYIKYSESTLSNPPKNSALDMPKAFDAMLGQLDASIQKKYHIELEWLAILHVLYYNTERILACFDANRTLIKETRNWIEERYPNWKKNPYLKSEAIAKRIPFVMIKNGYAVLLHYLRGEKRKIKSLLKVEKK